jgi:hypothetical protein
MNEQEIVSRLRAAGSAAELERLAGEIEADALAAPTAVIHQWATGDKTESGKAGSVVLDLDELAVTPMLGEFDSARVDWRFRLMESAVELLLQLRQRILAKLDGHLGREAVLETSGQAGPGATPVRVCDEAYLCVRRLAKVEQGAEGGFSSESEFLKLGPAERSREILRWRRSRTWAALCGADVGPEPD